MVYIYYMKNNILRLAIFVTFLFSPAFLNAQSVTVVRVTENKIYLDTSVLNRTVQKGDLFKVILAAEKLVNPKTGKDLGDVYTYSPEGKIVEVQPLYAVGELTPPTGISVGQEAVLTSAAKQTPAKVATVDAKQAEPSRTRIIYETLDQEIISLTEGNITASDSHNVATLSKEGQVTVWERGPKNALVEKMNFKFPARKRPITLSAATVKPGETAQLFAVTFDETRNALSTSVLETENGRLKETAVLPYFTKELGCGKDKKVWMQKPFVSAARPGNARLLIYENGKFQPAEETFSTQRNWLTGLNFYPVEKAGANNLVYTSSNGTIRVLLSNGKRAESKSLFAAAPNRVKYKQEVLKFYPSVQIFGPAGNTAVVAVENTAKLGVLSDTFGQYQNGKVHFLTFDKGRLNVQESLDFDGVIYDTACTDTALLAAEVLPSGSNVVEILK